MPITIACPSCKARLQAPDNAAGKKVKCPKCGTPIPVPAGGGSAPTPTRQPAAAPSKAPVKKAPQPDNDFNFDEEPAPKKTAPAKRPRDEDFDDEDDRPAKKAIKKGRDDDYDDEDDRPAKKGAIKKARDDDDYDDEPPRKKAAAKKGRDDDEDDEDDRPKNKKGKKGAAGKNYPPATEEDMKAAFNMYLFGFIANIVGSFVGLAGVGSLVFFIMWFMKRKESPLVDFHGKQGVNAVISSIAAFFLLGGLGCGGVFGLAAAGGGDPNSAMPWIGMIVGILFFGLVGLYSLWLAIAFFIGMFKAKAGEYWQWPLTLHLMK
jgi:uncharacterized Tic20 family protein